MKTGIHPDSKVINVTCSCGKEFNVASTLGEDTRVEICSNCHPFYTGEQRILKTGAVDKFYARQKKMEEMAAKKAPKKETKKPAAKKAAPKKEEVKTEAPAKTEDKVN